MDKFGPRWTFALNNIPLILALLLMSLAENLNMLIVGMCWPARWQPVGIPTAKSCA